MNIEQNIRSAFENAESQIRRYLDCREEGHDWEPYEPVKGVPYLIRKCRKCGCTEVNTR